MNTSSLSHLADGVLLRDLSKAVADERSATSFVVALIAEVDARKLYVPAGHPSMHSYCVHVLKLSEDEAHKRFQAARAAREFPVVLEALASGRVHLTAVVLIKPHLTAENVDELVALVTRKTKSQIQELLARKFPRAGLPSALHAVVPELSCSVAGVVPEPLDRGAIDQAAPGSLVPEPVAISAPPYSRLTPVSPEWSSLDTLLCREAAELMTQAFDLLGHRVRRGDANHVLTLALRELVKKLEKRKFGATDKPRRDQRRASTNPRYIPSDVRRRVFERDGSRCTFVTAEGHRCPATERLEYDHIVEAARGGHATVANIRLRCRAHNQYAAECTYGKEFMSRKREEARRATEERWEVSEVASNVAAAV